jgi:FtsP/CotA-like multicopper oxidase with cupredoxin domain
VIPNDNRTPSGRRTGNTLELHLEARLAGWRPDLDVDSAVTVQVFSELGEEARIPGPLLRAEQGMQIRVSIRNSIPDSTLVVYGFGADTLRIPSGETRETQYLAGAPGTYLYWGTTSARESTSTRMGRDGQLTGAIVIDPAGVKPDARERIFVMTVIDILPDSTTPEPREDIWELAINGLSWPHSERMEYAVGDTVRWRWLNGSYLPHPMHLHGYHFRVLTKGDGRNDTHFAPDRILDVVTEHMSSGTTFSMDWVPTRAGNWLFHCHMAPHITPFPERPDSVRAHDAHDVAQHATRGMAGLVLGITTTHRTTGTGVTPPTPARQLRLFAQETPTDSAHARAYGYVLQQGAEPRADSIVVPGPPLVLTRGETTAITVVNRTSALTTVHWHGMELESAYDGVAGWSGAGPNIAPLIAPGDSFVVAFTPPRAGTFIYHTHMDESAQLRSGMYGPMLVVEPGATFDPARDLVFMIGEAVEGAGVAATLNGKREPADITLAAGTTYRLRLINILPADVASISLNADSVPVSWTPISKDGADLPTALRNLVPASLREGVGETYDFAWTPAGRMDAELVIQITAGDVIRQKVRVR